MNLEAVTTAIAAVGAVIAAMFGIYRASGGHMKQEPSKPVTDIPSMVDAYLSRLQDIDRNLGSAVSTLQEIRKALEGTGYRQEAMVRELESMSRSMGRMENAQGSAAQVLVGLRQADEAQVKMLEQIREEIRNIGRDPRFAHFRAGTGPAS